MLVASSTTHPGGQIEHARWPEMNTWGTRWFTVGRCENLVGIEAINDSFKADVDAMRAAYEKSLLTAQGVAMGLPSGELPGKA